MGADLCYPGLQLEKLRGADHHLRKLCPLRSAIREPYHGQGTGRLEVRSKQKETFPNLF